MSESESPNCGPSLSFGKALGKVISANIPGENRFIRRANAHGVWRCYVGIRSMGSQRQDQLGRFGTVPTVDAPERGLYEDAQGWIADIAYPVLAAMPDISPPSDRDCDWSYSGTGETDVVGWA